MSQTNENQTSAASNNASAMNPAPVSAESHADSAARATTGATSQTVMATQSAGADAAKRAENQVQATSQTAANNIDTLRRWRQDFRATLAPSALENVNQLAAQLDLTHAHPSGIARLFATGKATLDSLYRDNGMLRASDRRVERVLDDLATKIRLSGMAELSLVVGIASWGNHHMPVLLYPVEIVRADAQSEANGTSRLRSILNSNSVSANTVIKFTGRVQLNDTFVHELAARNVKLDERMLFDGSRYESGTPETSAVFAAISDMAREQIEDFTIERHIVLGCFTDPNAHILYETGKIIDRLAQGATGNLALDALAGYSEAEQTLSKDIQETYSPFDADPHSEYEVGDVDNTLRYAAGIAASGRSLFVDIPSIGESSEQALAIASRCVMNGRSVLYVPGVLEQRKRFMQAVRANEMDSLVLDLAQSDLDKAIDRQLISAVSFQPGVATSRFDQLADELVGVRSRLTRYLGDLHGTNERWNVSAYQTIQNLASIASLSTHPATRVRLDTSTAQALNGSLDEWSAKLRRAGTLGEFSIGPEDTAWYHASVTSEEEAIGAYHRVVNVLMKLLPATREQVATTVKSCGFPVPNTAQQWGKQVTVLKNLRRVLDVFKPEIFERDIALMIEATLPKEQRKEQGSSMGFWQRRRHIKEAKSLLRAGAQVESLHEALKVVARQASQWRVFAPHGTWPVLPPKLDDIVETQEALNADLTALNMVLATTIQGADLQSADFNAVEQRLKALYDDKQALDTLPERCLLEREFAQVGLSALVEDLRTRKVDTNAVDGELRLAWWTTVFDDIVRSSAIISNQDGSAMQTAAERFAQVDVEHVRSVGPMVAQESMRRLYDMLFSRTQEANMLHTALAGSQRVSLKRIRKDHAEILAAAKPIMVASPATLSAVSDPAPLADVVILDAAAHVSSLVLLSVLARAKQIVILAHKNTVTSPAVRILSTILPSVTLEARASRRALKLNAFLESQGYGVMRYDAACQGAQGEVRFHLVKDASGVPVMASGLVESSQQEIDEVVRLITERASTFTIVPAGYILTVVTLTSVFRTRLGAELKSLASRDKKMGKFLRHVRLVDIDQVTGAFASDVILTLSYAKTTHGRLLQQFGAVSSPAGRGLLLDALSLSQRHVDIVSSFEAQDLQDERLHQPGAQLLKTMLTWAQNLDQTSVVPQIHEESSNILLNDLAQRIRARGLQVAVQYGFEGGMNIPLVVGLPDRPYALAVLSDDTSFMSIQSTRLRHRVLPQRLQSLGWSVTTVWSVGAFVNPEREVDRIVSQLSDMYQGR